MQFQGMCNSEKELIEVFLKKSIENILDTGDAYLYDNTIYLFTGNGIDVILKGGTVIDKSTEKLLNTINYNYKLKTSNALYFSILEKNKKIETIKKFYL